MELPTSLGFDFRGSSRGYGLGGLARDQGGLCLQCELCAKEFVRH
jgi:hypothetical protein